MCSTIPSKINAVLVKFPSEEACSKFVSYLLQNNIIVSHGNGDSNIGLDKSFVRISIGTKAQMEDVKQTISSFS